MLTGRASLILHNAQVLTGGSYREGRTLVAVRDGRVLWVGTEEDMQTFAGPATKVIDCQGCALGPGFIDAHLHLFAYAANTMGIDCTRGPSIPDVLEAVRRRAQAVPPGTWLRGWGIEAFNLAEQRLPTRNELDLAAPAHPVKLVHRSGHACILNSAALQSLGISEDTPEPPGATMGRDLATGALDGYMLEMDSFLQTRGEPALSRKDLLQGLAQAERRLLSLGVTSIHEATPTGALGAWDILQGLREGGGYAVKVYKMFAPSDLKELERRSKAFLTGDDGLRVGAIKIMLNETGPEVLPEQAELNEVVLQVLRAGYQVAFHAVEESAVAAALSAVEQAEERLAKEGQATQAPGQTTPAPGLRHRIEHAGLCEYPLRRRLARRGMWVVTQPAFVREHGDRYAAQMPERVDALYPIASFARDGVQIAFGSDCPVTPPDPFIGLAGAVGRRSRGGKAIGQREGISAIEATWMYTRAAAFASHDESRKGRIANGYLADMVLLSRNPWTAPAEALPDIRVLKTFVEGRLVWEGA